MSSPDVFDHYFPVLRNGARIVVSGAIGTPDLPVLRVPAASMYIRSIALIGVRSADLRAIRDFWQLVLDGFRIPANLLHATPLADAANTHDRIINGNATGNNVLTVDPTL